jgi:hypothetical protein
VKQILKMVMQDEHWNLEAHLDDPALGTIGDGAARGPSCTAMVLVEGWAQLELILHHGMMRHDKTSKIDRSK